MQWETFYLASQSSKRHSNQDLSQRDNNVYVAVTLPKTDVQSIYLKTAVSWGLAVNFHNHKSTQDIPFINCVSVAFKNSNSVPPHIEKTYHIKKTLPYTNEATAVTIH